MTESPCQIVHIVHMIKHEHENDGKSLKPRNANFFGREAGQKWHAVSHTYMDMKTVITESPCSP